VHKTYRQCENRHKHHEQNLYSGAYSIGVNPNRHRTISQCIMSQPELSPRSCRQCSHSVFIINEFAVAPPLLAIDISGHDLQLDNETYVKVGNVQYTYTLIGIVYYGDDHFTARIILEDGQIWFHDGITTGRNTIYDGSLALNCPDLRTCRGKRASLVIYSLN
jgi:hypothetical protein